mgnify:CR=1 FL=1
MGKTMDFHVKNLKNIAKVSSRNNGFFDSIFQWMLGGFGEDFRRVLGGVWRLLASLGSLFGIIFASLYSERSPKGLLEASGLHLSFILKGLGGVWEGFWEGFERI